jgi:cyclic beta-1,2-glucan synthetase
VAERTAAEMAADPDAPLRAELLSVEGLAERAREVAAAQRSAVSARPRNTPLGRLLERAGVQLAAVNTAMASGAREGRSVSPAMEWLLDNYYLVDEQVRTASADLPAGYGAELPRLTAGPLAGFPRIYEVAVTLLAHTDARVEADHLERFVMAYQESAPLSIGEMWAIPIVLRVALVEDIRRLSRRVNQTFTAEQAAESWADRLLLAMEDQPASLPDLLSSMSRGSVAGSTSFRIRLGQRMADQERDVSAVTGWIERAEHVMGANQLVLAQAEHQRQAADQVSIANAITAIRFVDATDWRAFFERCSIVEAELRRDPAGIYARMDFPSRDRYRHALEQLAKRCPVSEPDVALDRGARASVRTARGSRFGGSSTGGSSPW